MERNLECEGRLFEFPVEISVRRLTKQFNLHTWGLIEDPICIPCKDKQATLHHILSACPVALKDERYKGRRKLQRKQHSDQIHCIVLWLKETKQLARTYDLFGRHNRGGNKRTYAKY